VTIAGYGNGTVGHDTLGLWSPVAIIVKSNNDFYLSDANNHRVLYFQNGSRVGHIVAGNGTSGTSLAQLAYVLGIYVNTSTNGLYIADCTNSRIQFWNMNATQGITIVNSSSSPSLSYVSGVKLDAYGNMYVSEYYNNRIVCWPPNGTTGIVIAGNINGASGSDNQSFNTPMQFDFDSNGEYIYIADQNNHRIQRWKLSINCSAPVTTGVTVAGGNGPGPAANQLKKPLAVYVSKKTGGLYVSDSQNCRIQYWVVGAMQGVTVAGGAYGIEPTQLNLPSGVSPDVNETYLYVTDQANHRVQRFQLL
jgi:DNA-binding beta-propeller fold protein YncE